MFITEEDIKSMVIDKISELNKEMSLCNTVEELHRLEGKLDLLEEIFDDLTNKMNTEQNKEFIFLTLQKWQKQLSSEIK